MFDEIWFLTAGPMVCIPMILTELPEGVSSRSITVTNKSNSLTYTVASSLVCTSLLALIAVVGLRDVLMVLQLSRVEVSLADHMHTRSGINYKLSFLLLTQPGVHVPLRASGMLLCRSL